MKTIASFATFLLLAAFAHADEVKPKITLAIHTPPKASESISDLLLEIMEVELVGQPDLELVDRERLQAIIAEQRLGAGGVTGEQAASFGKLVGANYYVFGESSAMGESHAVRCRVVQVETGVYRPVLLIVPSDQDPMKAGADLAAKVRAEIGKLAEREITKPTEETADFKVAEGAKLPSLAFRIPETSVTPGAANADPAGEKSLEAFVLKHDFKLIQLSRPSQAVQNGIRLFGGAIGEARHLEGEEHEALLTEAKAKGVDILIIGIASSQHATQISSFHTGRARVELAAVDVQNNRVLATTSGYGIATDLSQFVAEKKAIEQATEKLNPEFVTRIVEAHNRK
jgi:hypothetical protein